MILSSRLDFVTDTTPYQNKTMIKWRNKPVTLVILIQDLEKGLSFKVVSFACQMTINVCAARKFIDKVVRLRCHR